MLILPTTGGCMCCCGWNATCAQCRIGRLVCDDAPWWWNYPATSTM